MLTKWLVQLQCPIASGGPERMLCPRVQMKGILSLVKGLLDSVTHQEALSFHLVHATAEASQKLLEIGISIFTLQIRKPKQGRKEPVKTPSLGQSQDLSLGIFVSQNKRLCLMIDSGWLASCHSNEDLQILKLKTFKVIQNIITHFSGEIGR